MSLILPSIGAFGHTVEGGGGGSFTFTLQQSNNGAASSSFNNPPAGCLAVFVASNRDGTSMASATVSDGNSGSWTKVGHYDNELGDSGSRHANVVWVRETTSTDASSGVCNATIASGGSALSIMAVYQPNTSVTWALGSMQAAFNGSGTGAINGTSSGSTSSISGSDVFVLGGATARLASSGIMTTFTVTQTDQTHTRIIGINSQAYHVAVEGTSVGSGTQTTTAATDGAGDKGIAFVFGIPVS